MKDSTECEETLEGMEKQHEKEEKRKVSLQVAGYDNIRDDFEENGKPEKTTEALREWGRLKTASR